MLTEQIQIQYQRVIIIKSQQKPMVDIQLDDLIKKDKQQLKANRGNNKLKTKTSKFNHNFTKNPQNRNSKNFGKNNNDNRPFKNKFIKKQHQGQRQKRYEPKQQKFQNKPNPQTKQHKQQDDPKQFRTLKVVGLSPQFTNQDLYKLFATEGALEKCLIQQDNFGRTLLTAIVKYHSSQSAKSAIQNLNRHKIMNCVLGVSPYKNSKRNY